MALSRADVEKVALLARLRLSEDELATMTAQLAQIVEYVDHLSEVDTDQVTPMAHAVEVHNIFRDDRVADSLLQEEALANAPHRSETGYLVPAVLGD